MKKAIDFFTAHPARFFLVAALLWGGFRKQPLSLSENH
jgi:hypothetical protein